MMANLFLYKGQCHEMALSFYGLFFSRHPTNSSHTISRGGGGSLLQTFAKTAITPSSDHDRRIGQTLRPAQSKQLNSPPCETVA